MITENLSTLKIHKLTQEQYDRELANGRIDENALYLIPDEEINMSLYATIEQLNGKADSEHSHDDQYCTEAEIDGKVSEINAALSGKADASHVHTISDVSGLQAALDNNLSTAKQYADDAVENHNHDDIYYTKSEINSKLDQKANISHTHEKSDIGLENVENKSSATIRGELTKENVISALGYDPSLAITDKEIDEICGDTLATYLNSIAAEGVSF